MQILPLVDVEENEEDKKELEHVQFYKPPMKVIQFKVIFYTSQ